MASWWSKEKLNVRELQNTSFSLLPELQNKNSSSILIEKPRSIFPNKSHLTCGDAQVSQCYELYEPETVVIAMSLTNWKNITPETSVGQKRTRLKDQLQQFIREVGLKPSQFLECLH